MLWEAWQYLTTPASPIARKMGYLYEAIAMAARLGRCRYSWQPHYQQCQQAIKHAMVQCKTKRTALIMGAGSLQDIPLAQLSVEFERVLLVDMVFLKHAKHQAATYSNVQCIELDVTESVENIFHGVMQITAPQAWLSDDQVDLVVSLNLITQLPLLPVSWLMKHFHIDETQADKIGQALISAHLAYLQKFNAPVCLIADRMDREFDSQNQLIDEFDPWWGITQPGLVQSWDWELMPLAESGRLRKSQVNQVGVSYFNLA